MTTQLKHKGCMFNWGEDQQHRLDKLTVAVSVPPVLEVVDLHKPFIVETEASATTIGAILLQDSTGMTSSF